MRSPSLSCLVNVPVDYGCARIVGEDAGGGDCHGFFIGSVHLVNAQVERIRGYFNATSQLPATLSKAEMAVNSYTVPL